MANIIKIKSSPDSASGANTPAAGDLKLAELGYSFKSDKLFVGSGDGATADAIQISYDHPTSDGSKHVPANGTGNNGKVLTASGTAGTYTWADAATTYTLPTAASGTKGGVKIGENLTMTGEVLSATDTVLTDAQVVTAAKTNDNISALATFSGTPVFTDTGTTLSFTPASRVLASSTGGNVTLPLAVTGTDGLMSSADKAILDTIAPLITEGGSSTIIDTVQEVIAAFQDHGEGLNLISELDAKLTSTSTIDGGAF